MLSVVTLIYHEVGETPRTDPPVLFNHDDNLNEKRFIAGEDRTRSDVEKRTCAEWRQKRRKTSQTRALQTRKNLHSRDLQVRFS